MYETYKTPKCQLCQKKLSKKSERMGLRQKILQNGQYLETSNECVRYWQTAEDSLKIFGNLRIFGKIFGNLRIFGKIFGDLKIFGKIFGDLRIFGKIVKPLMNVSDTGRRLRMAPGIQLIMLIFLLFFFLHVFGKNLKHFMKK